MPGAGFKPGSSSDNLLIFDPTLKTARPPRPD